MCFETMAIVDCKPFKLAASLGQAKTNVDLTYGKELNSRPVKLAALIVIPTKPRAISS
jgi:hypothetical protein